jgi:hypothetical protein
LTRTLWIALTLVGGLAVGLMARQARAGSYEQPAYTIVEEGDGFEVREYAPSLEARVTVEGTYREALNQGFRILAGFIFGGNTPQESIDMTTPVTASPQDGESIAMTSPVGVTPHSPDRSLDAARWTVSFTMPRDYTADTLPAPDDPRIEIVQTERRRVAVRSFSWRATDDRSAEQLDALMEALDSAGHTPAGEPQVAQYDPPWILGPFRTNEVWVPLAP